MFGYLIAMNASKVNHQSRTEQHRVNAEQPSHWEFIVIEGTFEGPDGGFHGGPQVTASSFGLGTPLATQGQFKLLPGEVYDRRRRGFGRS